MEVEQSRQGFFSITLTVKWRRLSSQPASLVQWPVSSFQISAFLAVWLWPTHGTSHFFACKMCVGLWRLDDVNHAPRMQQWHRRMDYAWGTNLRYPFQFLQLHLPPRTPTTSPPVSTVPCTLLSPVLLLPKATQSLALSVLCQLWLASYTLGVSGSNLHFVV